MRIIIRPVVDRQHEIDLTQRLIAAIAEELWRLYGGNEQLNWLEAEMHLNRIVGDANAAAEVTGVLLVETPVTGPRSRSEPRCRAARRGRRHVAVTA